MSLFICEKCGCIENTACGHYHTKDMIPCWKDSSLDGLALCSECSPTIYRDGSPNRRGGKWHGHFPKQIATQELIDKIGRENFIELPVVFGGDPPPPAKEPSRKKPKPRSRRH